jgi:type II secretory pathway pseudopilin PulG
MPKTSKVLVEIVRRNMRYKKNKNYRALTLLEMIIALSIMSIVFAVILPQFRAIQNSWDSKQGTSEALQNARVLIDHLNYNLSKAIKVTSVSDSAETDGFIEFEDNDGNTIRYDIANNYVQFGLLASPSDLAGPISSLQFTCYDGNDFANSTTDINSIRFVEIQATLTNSAANAQDKTLSTAVYLHTNGLSSSSLQNFGNETIENEELNNCKNIQICTQVTLPVDITVISISAYIKGPPPKLVRYAIYTDNAGEPDTLVVESEAQAVDSESYYWQTISITPAALSAGTYWLALAFEHNTMYLKQSEEGLGQTRHKNNNAVDNGFTASWGASDETNTRRVNMYATYIVDEGILP